MFILLEHGISLSVFVEFVSSCLKPRFAAFDFPLYTIIFLVFNSAWLGHIIHIFTMYVVFYDCLTLYGSTHARHKRNCSIIVF